MQTFIAHLRSHKHRSALVLLCLLGFLLIMLSPAWASPSQSPHRQTVPEPTLTPEAYLPVVLKEQPATTSTSHSFHLPNTGR